ncbi:hypothetical protein RO3G_02276 [Lichtheimia corymbifera JMRC:FSU:9682]|uniref:IMS import disulfide relay-system CHCH-CHCH-like Cx9C domain-containing protein n=1 Tax=Lichtheimia corymbifera JMRC:FSU:9682 TaxID=1263082 RepID=A0A068S8B6_9FUNG|nr:hypothetical protein RO3G_02276 [Lichtheimia corymbifera JMRC:FSU:9682]
MDDTLAQVQAKCALQLEMYQKCVGNYPDSWDKSCVQQRNALTKCSEEHVGILKYVKQHCTSQIKAYDECLSANQTEPEKCVSALRELYLCTEATSAAYRQQQSKNDATDAKDQPSNTEKQ